MKFEKGSQEAKDYMASLRAKRVSGCGAKAPERNQPLKGVQSATPNEAEEDENAERLRQQEAMLDDFIMPPPPIRRRPMPIRGRPTPITIPFRPTTQITRQGEGVIQDVVKTIKKETKKGRRILNKAVESITLASQGGRTNYPPNVRRILKANGEKKIVSATINRKPIQAKFKSLLNVLSFGQFERNIKNEPYDDLFHLSIVLRTEDGKEILVEKNETINMLMKPRKGGENSPVTPFPTGKTLNEIMDNTQKRMGDGFFKYSAQHNNCQHFIMALLQSNSMGDSNDFSFVKQDANQMFKKMDTLSNVADFVTTLASAGDIIMKGKGGKSSKIAMLYDDDFMLYDDDEIIVPIIRKKPVNKPVASLPVQLIEDNTPSRWIWAAKIKQLEEEYAEAGRILKNNKKQVSIAKEIRAYQKAIEDNISTSQDDVGIDLPMDALEEGDEESSMEGMGGFMSRGVRIEPTARELETDLIRKEIEKRRAFLFNERKRAVAEDLTKMKGRGAGVPFPPPPPSNIPANSVMKNDDLLNIISQYNSPEMKIVPNTFVFALDRDQPRGYQNYRSRVLMNQILFYDGTKLSTRDPFNESEIKYYDEEGDRVFPRDFIPPSVRGNGLTSSKPKGEIVPVMGRDDVPNIDELVSSRRRDSPDTEKLIQIREDFASIDRMDNILRRTHDGEDRRRLLKKRNDLNDYYMRIEYGL